MEKLEGMSLDLTKLNIEKLKELFPMIDVDGKIDFDMLRTILGDEVDDSREKYQFTWNGKTDSIRLAQSPSSATLRPCKEESKDWDTTENLYIEGDNLEVLKQLQKTYYGKVKMIYIDPPYNTGKDFVYKDNFKNSIENYKEQTEQGMSSNPETNGRYHRDWLNMMYPRLILARTLLKEDGVIFISIDDNEINNLKKICDEIFSISNFIGQITIVGNPRGRDYGGVARMHDYLLVYKKSSKAEINLIEDTENKFKMFDKLGGFELRELRNRNIKFNKENRPNLYYPFYIDPITSDEYGLHPISLEYKEGWIKLYPLVSQGINTVWRWGKEKASKNLNINICAKPMRNGSYMIVEKYRESRMMARSVWWDKNSNTEKGTLLVKALFQGKVFDYPKTVEMIMRICDMGTDKYNNDIVLDFFSGSSTTAHAVMQLNTKDGGNRRFIMVQLPEKTDMESAAYKAGYKNICEIGKERIRRAGELIKKEYQKSNPEKEFTTDIGFKVFKLDSTNIKPWENTNKLHTEQLSYLEEVFKKDRNKEDILYEILLKYGLFDMSVSEVDINGKTMYRVGRRYMLVCLEDNINASDIKEIIELSPRVVVFKETGFNNDNDKINAEYNLKKAGIEEIKCI